MNIPITQSEAWHKLQQDLGEKSVIKQQAHKVKHGALPCELVGIFQFWV